MTASIIDLSLWDLVTVYSLLLMSIGLAHLLKAGQSKDLFWSGLRMFIQLLVVGYVLHLIFALETPLPVLLILIVMIGFAVQTIGARVKTKMPHFYRVVGTAILFGCGGMVFFFKQKTAYEISECD